MEKSSDPKDFHARICVLENDNKRHCEDIDKIWGRVSALEICAACLPEIKESLKSIVSKVDELASSSTENLGRTKGKTTAFLSLREWGLACAGILALLLDHFVIK